MRTLLLFLAGVMTASASAAENVSPCPGDALPIQITNPGGSPIKLTPGGSEITFIRPGVPDAKRPVAELPHYLQHFSALVTAVTEHVAARLVRDQLCIRAGSAEKMHTDEWRTRSWFQFVYWPLFMSHEYIVPAMDSSGASLFPSCRISSPWMDLIVDRSPVPLIRGIVYLNERQLLADQAALAGVRHVPPGGRAMPPKPNELGRFMADYEYSEIRREPTAKPVEERVPPDILWLLRYSSQSTIMPFVGFVNEAIDNATRKSVPGYTQLVLTLIDRCFDSSASGRVDLHYDIILDVADPGLLDLYKIDTPRRRRSKQSPAGEIS